MSLKASRLKIEINGRNRDIEDARLRYTAESCLETLGIARLRYVAAASKLNAAIEDYLRISQLGDTQWAKRAKAAAIAADFDATRAQMDVQIALHAKGNL